jgi:outer membrane lipoprotein-sorting protein
MSQRRAVTLSLVLALCMAFAATASAQDAAAIVKESFDYMRGKASISTCTMTIHRPDWTRSMTIKAWTLGQSDSLFYITKPPKDEGNGTLKKGGEMWMYNPKVNRVIKLPPSMMSQAWMGSDFSNNDLAKTDSLIKDYTHTLEKTGTMDGKKVFFIKSMPKPRAPVVWGMQKLKIREDHIFLQQDFYDEDLKLVKSLTLLDIKPMGGRLYPAKWRMQKADVKGKYTVVGYEELKFKDSLPESRFTLSNLRNPRF